MVAIQKTNKRAQIIGRNKFIRLFFSYIIYTWAIIHTYDSQIAESNAYAGMFPWEMTIAGWICMSIIFPVLVLITSNLKGYPSDFFIIFYSAIPILAFCTLTSTSGKITNNILLPSLFVVVLPLFSLIAMKKFFPKIKWRGIISSKIIDQVLLVVLLLVIAYSYMYSPESAGFDIINSYDRRMEGRDIYAAGSLIAYAQMMCMNGFTPYLAYRGSLKRQSSLICVAFAFALFFYWLLGVKSPLVYVLVGCVVGYLIGRNSQQNFVNYFIAGIVGLYFFVLIEWWLSVEYSLIVEYGFRRLFAVQAQIQGYYLDFLLINSPSFWNFLSGVHEQSFSATYYIGGNYMGDLDSNANTNAFLYAFVANGVLGYLVAIFFVTIFLVLMDRLYIATKNPTYILIGFIYGYLITEQAFLTAFVSSGVGFLFLLTFIEKFDISTQKF